MIFSLIINGASVTLSPLLGDRHKDSNFGCCFCLRGFGWPVTFFANCLLGQRRIWGTIQIRKEEMI